MISLASIVTTKTAELVAVASKVTNQDRKAEILQVASDLNSAIASAQSDASGDEIMSRLFEMEQALLNK